MVQYPTVCHNLYEPCLLEKKDYAIYAKTTVNTIHLYQIILSLLNFSIRSNPFFSKLLQWTLQSSSLIANGGVTQKSSSKQYLFFFLDTLSHFNLT